MSKVQPIWSQQGSPGDARFPASHGAAMSATCRRFRAFSPTISCSRRSQGTRNRSGSLSPPLHNEARNSDTSAAFRLRRARRREPCLVPFSSLITRSCPTACENITRALHRSWIHDANTIEVSAQGGKIRLTGHVTTWNARDLAGNTAWSAPGATFVENKIAVD